MRKSALLILAIPLLMPATGCTGWSDFVAPLEHTADSPVAGPIKRDSDAAEPLPTLARVYLKAGEKARERGDSETARRFFDKARDLAPGMAPPTPRHLKADAENPRGGATTATAAGGLRMRATELVKLYEQPPAAADEATSLHRHAISHDFFGHHQLAQEAYRKALALAPDDIAVRNNLALSLTLSGAYGDAVRQMSHVTASSRATARHRHTLEMLLQLAFQQEGATRQMHAARDSWRKNEQVRRQAPAPVPNSLRPGEAPDLSRIAPSSGTPATGNPGAAADLAAASPGAEPPDPIAWVARTLSTMWTRLNRTLAAPEASTEN